MTISQFLTFRDLTLSRAGIQHLLDLHKERKFFENRNVKTHFNHTIGNDLQRILTGSLTLIRESWKKNPKTHWKSYLDFWMSQIRVKGTLRCCEFQKKPFIAPPSGYESYDVIQITSLWSYSLRVDDVIVDRF